jgi:methenyltetrahydrofolate cyclohydrolase
MSRPLSDLTIQEWLERLEGVQPAPGSGCASAMNAANAAAVVAMTAGRSPRGGEIAAQAVTLRSRLIGLAEVDADVYRAAREALESAEEEPDEDQRELAVGIPVAEAAEAVILIAEAAADVACLAAEAAKVGEDDVPADAQAAAALAAGAAEAAAHLVAVNVPSGPGLRRARDAAGRAALMARQLASGDSVRSAT